MDDSIEFELLDLLRHDFYDFTYYCVNLLSDEFVELWKKQVQP